MARVKGVTSKRKKKILSSVKGFHGARGNHYKVARESLEKALQYSYRDRRNRKRDFRNLWNIRINAAARLNGLSYSRFIYGLSKAGVAVNRKVLADLAVSDPTAFSALVEKAKSSL